MGPADMDDDDGVTRIRAGGVPIYDDEF
jgi:hypothetical protein